MIYTVSGNHSLRHVTSASNFDRSLELNMLVHIMHPLMQTIWREMGEIGWLDIVYILLVFISVFLIVRWFIQWIKYIRTIPPGPWGLPFLGYLPFMKGELHLRYSELAQKYGPIFSARMGNQLVVVLSDYRVIRDTFRREEFTGRPHTEFTNILDGYGKCRAQQIPIIRFISRLSHAFVSSEAEGRRLKHSARGSLVFRANSRSVGFIKNYNLFLAADIRRNIFLDLRSAKYLR